MASLARAFRQISLPAKVLLCCGAVWSQTPSVTVRGMVKDVSGGVVKAATISLTNIDQQRRWSTRTGDLGEYLFAQIPPGNYTLSCGATGFKKYDHKGLVLQVSQTAQEDIALELGSIGETVQVTAETPLTDPESSSLGGIVNRSSLEALPLFTRDIKQLLALTPGISDSPAFRAPAFSSGNSSPYSANGGPGGSNEILLDGSPQTVLGSNQAAYIPQPEATQEFSVQTNSLSAEYGRSGGAVINIVHRSGSKEFHGEVYEFLRNEKLNANGFFENRNGKSRALFRGNDFGFVLGGPLTRARNSTFFFVNVQRILVAVPVPQIFTVPTVRMRNGDFGEVGPVYDPNAVDAAGRRQPFPGNQIPAFRWNSVGANLLNYYPDPTSPGVDRNYFGRATEYPSSTDVSTKIDRRLSQRQSMFGRFSMAQGSDRKANLFGNIASPDWKTLNSKTRSVTLDDSYSRGTWILHANYGYAYNGNASPPAAPGFDPVSLGFPASMSSGLQLANFPSISSGTNLAGLGPTNSSVFYARLETHALSGDAIRVAGKHTFKFGGTYRVNRDSFFQSNLGSGGFTFSEGFTRSAIVSNTGGNAAASLLLGLPFPQQGSSTAGGAGYEPALAVQQRYFGLFIQDDWRVGDRLTLNLGLRWDTDRPLTERFDRTSWFDFDATPAKIVPGLGPLRGGLVFAGRNGGPRGNKDPDNNNFGPRIGVAYQVNPRFVLRSGFGLMYSAPLNNGPNASNTGALGFNAFTDYVSTVSAAGAPLATLSNPFPNGFNSPANGRDGLLTFIGQNTSAQIRGDRTPYVAQWHAGVQYELRNQVLLEAGYAGSAGVKLPVQAQLNQLPDQYLALGTALKAQVPNPFVGIIPATSSLGLATVDAGQLLRPYPQFSNLTQTWGSLAHSSYHALELKFRKRYRGGLQVLGAYTWSKMLDDNSGAFNGGNQSPGFTNNNRRDLDKSYSAFDIPHRFVASFEWELPFGWRRPLLNRKGLVNEIAGGWRMSGMSNYQSGPPITVTVQGAAPSYNGTQRPDRTGISSRTPGPVGERIDNYLDRAAFAFARSFTFGNAGRFLPENRAPGRQQWDVALDKSFSISERLRLDFRLEVFNLLNHVNFLGPASVFGQDGFGTITKAESPRLMQVAMKLHF